MFLLNIPIVRGFPTIPNFFFLKKKNIEKVIVVQKIGANKKNVL